MSYDPNYQPPPYYGQPPPQYGQPHPQYGHPPHGGYGGGGQGGGGGSGFGPGCMYIAAGLILVTALLFLCCGGGFVLMNTGFQMMTAQARGQVASNPVVVDNIGRIHRFEIRIGDSLTRNEELVFDIQGDKGKGILTVQYDEAPDGSVEVRSGQLQMDDGRRFDL